MASGGPFPPEPDYTSPVAARARRTVDVAEPPPIDPAAIERAYRRERAKRRARAERSVRARYASLRFWFVLWLLLFASVLLALAIWQQIQQLFGL